MVHENEIVMLILGIGVLFFIVVNYSQLKRFPAINTLIAGFCFTLTGWFFTVLEGYMLATLFNIVEHSCYLAGALCVAQWTRRALNSDRKTD